jgi:hypothetical protein
MVGAMMRIVTAATGAVLAAVFLTTAASAQAQTAEFSLRRPRSRVPLSPPRSAGDR